MKKARAERKKTRAYLHRLVMCLPAGLTRAVLRLAQTAENRF